MIRHGFLWFSLGIIGALVAELAIAKAPKSEQEVFKVFGKTFQLDHVNKAEQSKFFEIEQQRYELIENVARQEFLTRFWQQRAKEKGKSVDQVKEEYMNKNVKVSEKEVKEMLERFKDHPQLQKLGKEEQDRQVRMFLQDRNTQSVVDGIIDGAVKKGELSITYPKPMEPEFELKITKDDHVRYGPDAKDTKAIKCSGDNCPITVVEYSEFQCVFCKRAQPDVKKVLKSYKGKIRWIMRDFPLGFHERAEPASVAAHCAGQQGKFWHMYDKLFENQSDLEDKDLENYGKQVSGLDFSKYQACLKKPDAVTKLIEKNKESGAKHGVTGTPTFFVNGRRNSGVLSFDKFRTIIEEELAKAKKS